MTDKPKSENRKHYELYIASPVWRQRRQASFEMWGRECFLCGESGEAAALDIHHRRYPPKYPVGDLFRDDTDTRNHVPLCRACHDFWHRAERAARERRTPPTMAPVTVEPDRAPMIIVRPSAVVSVTDVAPVARQIPINAPPSVVPVIDAPAPVPRLHRSAPNGRIAPKRNDA